MSLYTTASQILISNPTLPLSPHRLQSHLFSSKPPTKTSSSTSSTSSSLSRPPAPTQIFALLTESTKWSPLLTPLIARSSLLTSEEKHLTPTLALLLVHDLLLAKRGLALPKNHHLRKAVERHQTRLKAEFVRERVKRGCRDAEELRGLVEGEWMGRCEAAEREGGGEGEIEGEGGREEGKGEEDKNGDRDAGKGKRKWRHPRWVRVNTLRTNLASEIGSGGTFEGWRVAGSLQEVMAAGVRGKVYHVDEHVPDLIALPPNFAVGGLRGYVMGKLVVQDKASCFPAFLLDPGPEDGVVLDTCAAPGNKSTHLAGLLRQGGGDVSEGGKGGKRVLAVERDRGRAQVLRKMVARAGCGGIVEVFGGVDFLSLNVEEEPWCNVGAIVLDPSCSGSGIVGRKYVDGEGTGRDKRGIGEQKEEELLKTIPGAADQVKNGMNGKKRKRKRGHSQDEKIYLEGATNGNGMSHNIDVEEEALEAPKKDNTASLSKRLTALSNLQTQMLIHAFRFPRARKITYSTCSVYDQENETVVVSALASHIARQKGWRVLRREEQIEGLKAWDIRGKIEPCRGVQRAEEIAEGFIRCEKLTDQGTQGFFVAGFVRTEGYEERFVGNGTSVVNGDSQVDEESKEDGLDEGWEGFDD